MKLVSLFPQFYVHIKDWLLSYLVLVFFLNAVLCYFHHSLWLYYLRFKFKFESSHLLFSFAFEIKIISKFFNEIDYTDDGSSKEKLTFYSTAMQLETWNAHNIHGHIHRFFSTNLSMKRAKSWKQHKILRQNETKQLKWKQIQRKWIKMYLTTSKFKDFNTRDFVYKLGLKVPKGFTIIGFKKFMLFFALFFPYLLSR